MQIESTGSGALERRFAQHLTYLFERTAGSAEQAGRVGLAVSGGSDSMALALLAHAALGPGKLFAWTVDHALRPESAVEAAQVAEWLATYGIPHRTLRWEHDIAPRGNLQAAARQARYGLLSEAGRAEGVDYVLLGHTEDDQAETVALRQERGAGPAGLAGMAAVTEGACGAGGEQAGAPLFLRPLLAFRRDELRAYLRACGQRWIDDPSNEKEEFARIRIRRALARDPSWREELLALGARMAGERQRIEREFACWAAKEVNQHAPSTLRFTLTSWRALAAEDALYALSRMLPAVSGRSYPPRYRELQRLAARLGGEAQGKATLGRCRIVWRKDEVRLWPEELVKPPTAPHIAECGGAFLLAKPLVARPFFRIERSGSLFEEV